MHCAALGGVAALPGKGIGSELVSRMPVRLKDLDMVDLLCDPDDQSFFARCGLKLKLWERSTRGPSGSGVHGVKGELRER